MTCQVMRESTWSHFTAASLIKQHTMITVEHMTPEIKLRLITPSCELWTAKVDDTPFEDPYWAFYWPGGQAVARFVLDNPLLMVDKRVLDFGSGSGACAIAAAMSGADTVTANDIDPVAISAIKMNCALNNVHVDVCSKNLIGDCCEDWDCILLGDMFYDSDFAEQLISWLHDASSKGKLVMIGDPGRHAFRETDRNKMMEVARYRMPQKLCVENNGFTDASVWMLT